MLLTLFLCLMIAALNLSATGTPTPSHGELSHSNKALTTHP